MRAIAIEQFGGPEVVRLIELPLPEPRAGQVRIKVAASALNPVDLGTRSGVIISQEEARFPMVLGWDLAGAIDAVGPDVAAWSIGDKVIALSPQPRAQVGTHAEYVVLSTDLLAPYPSALAPEEAAALPLAGVTAYQALEALEVRPGQTLLVNNPLGAVAGGAVQMAAHRGVLVVAPASVENEEFVRALGVEVILSPDKSLAEQLESLAPGGVDGALDVLGGQAAVETFAAVREGGRYATTVPVWWIAGGVYEPARGITPQVIMIRPDAAHLREVSHLANAGVVRPRVAKVMPFEAAQEGHQLLAAPGLRGKVIFVPQT